MVILTLKTDQQQAEVAIYEDETKRQAKTWTAHRQLAETIHTVIDEVCQKADLSLHDIRGIVCFEGPGSFTGLRIGLSVGNALAYAFQIPIVKAGGDDWALAGIARLRAGENDDIIVPVYGGEANVTAPRK